MAMVSRRSTGRSALPVTVALFVFVGIAMPSFMLQVHRACFTSAASFSHARRPAVAMHEADPSRWWFMEEQTRAVLGVGSSVEILRSDNSWSRASVTDMQEDGTTVVQIDDTKAVKRVPKGLMDKYIRELEPEPEAELEAVLETATGPYEVGDAVEVLRSDGAWTSAVVKEIMDDGTHAVRIVDKGSPYVIKKIIHAKHVPKFIRNASPKRSSPNDETSPEFSVSVGYGGQ